MSTGDSYKSLQYGFRVAFNTISLIVLQTPQAIINELLHENITCPGTLEQWPEVAEPFVRRWNFFKCLGALDGKNVALHCPRNRRSWYFNYKFFFSIVHMALVGARVVENVFGILGSRFRCLLTTMMQNQ